MVDRPLIVWDTDGEPPVGEGLVCAWNSYAVMDGVISVLRHVEENADRLRDRYLAWVDELGESVVGGRRVVDLLGIRHTDFSLWWMSSIFEKSFWNTPTMARVVRLLALDEILASCGPAEVTVVSDRPEVRQAVRRLAIRHGAACRMRRPSGVSLGDSVRRRLRRLVPRPVHAARSLMRYSSTSRPAQGRTPVQWNEGDRTLLFVSCFGHLTADEAAAGRFDSRYWTGLYEVFQESGISTNWLQYFVTSSDIPDFPTAVDWLARIDANPDDQGTHAFVNGYLTLRVMRVVVIRWLQIAVLAVRLRRLADPEFGPRDHGFLWPVVRDEWRDDLRGDRSMHNLLWLGVFEAACADLPLQHRGVYLYEGASWERAFVHAWRANGHGELIGVPHATIRFWDLRYYVDSRTRVRDGMHSLPQPDRMVRNNVTAATAFAVTSVPEHVIVDCEALRYSHLADISRVESSHDRSGPLRVLILGEVRPGPMAKMLDLLVDAVDRRGLTAEFTVKPHPNSPIRVDDYPSLNLLTVSAPLSALVGDFDVAYSCNGTSAGVDVYLAGLPVIVRLDDKDLNLSDLRGWPEVRFVGDSTDLVDALQAVADGRVGSPAPTEFFTLDPGLPRWRRLLAADRAW